MIPTGIINIPPIVGVPALFKCSFGPSSRIICLNLKACNFGIPHAVINDESQIESMRGMLSKLLGTYVSERNPAAMTMLIRKTLSLLLRD